MRAPGETYDVVVETKDIGLQFSSVTNGCVVDGVDARVLVPPLVRRARADTHRSHQDPALTLHQALHTLHLPYTACPPPALLAHVG